jgi:hypothetical protein
MPYTYKIREWLKVVLGPTADVDGYSNGRCVDVFNMMYGFYGSTIMKLWEAPTY